MPMFSRRDYSGPPYLSELYQTLTTHGSVDSGRVALDEERSHNRDVYDAGSIIAGYGQVCGWRTTAKMLTRMRSSPQAQTIAAPVGRSI